ncbi:MAG: hypothetical protein WCE40_04580 [Polyangia bacterium]
MTFFDILGFGEMVKNAAPEEIAACVSLLQMTGKIDDDTGQHFEAQSFQFSDSVVRMMPIDSETNTQYPVGLLFHEVQSILLASIEMANRGVFLRGALTLGEAYFSGEMMFGPAMVRAYELESRVAVYPRVVVDPIVIEALKTEPRLKKDTHDLSDEAAKLLQLLRRDADGLWFVDFLYAGRDELDRPEFYGNLLENNKKSIERRLGARKVLDDVAIKALWAAHYHNQVLDRLICNGADEGQINGHRVSIPPHLFGALTVR